MAIGNQKLVENLKVLIDEALNINIDDLIRRDLGEHGFQDSERLFSAVISVLQYIKATNFSNVPDLFIRTINEHVHTLKSDFDRTLKIEPTINNFLKEKTNCTSNLRNHYEELIKDMPPIFMLDTACKSNLLTSSVSEESEKLKNEYKNASEEIKSILESMRQASAKVGVANYSNVFFEESNQHELNARNWLIGVYIIAGLITLIGLCFLLFTNMDNQGIIHFTVSKIIILTVLFYTLSMCSKNYKAHKHNAVVNKHRYNALKTFEAFAKASGDDLQTKNAVLLETTRSIFSTHNTGYNNAESSDSEYPSRIIEIFKNTKA